MFGLRRTRNSARVQSCDDLRRKSVEHLAISPANSTVGPHDEGQPSNIKNYMDHELEQQFQASDLQLTKPTQFDNNNAGDEMLITFSDENLEEVITNGAGVDVGQPFNADEATKEHLDAMHENKEHFFNNITNQYPTLSQQRLAGAISQTENPELRVTTGTPETPNFEGPLPRLNRTQSNQITGQAITTPHALKANPLGVSSVKSSREKINQSMEDLTTVQGLLRQTKEGLQRLIHEVDEQRQKPKIDEEFCNQAEVTAGG